MLPTTMTPAAGPMGLHSILPSRPSPLQTPSRRKVVMIEARPRRVWQGTRHVAPVTSRRHHLPPSPFVTTFSKLRRGASASGHTAAGYHPAEGTRGRNPVRPHKSPRALRDEGRSAWMHDDGGSAYKLPVAPIRRPVTGANTRSRPSTMVLPKECWRSIGARGIGWARAAKKSRTTPCDESSRLQEAKCGGRGWGGAIAPGATVEGARRERIASKKP